MAKQKSIQIVRLKYSVGYPIVKVSDETQTNPDLSCEISDLFKQVDESGEVNNFAYSDTTPVNAYGSDFAEGNETTYQGAYEEWQFKTSPVEQAMSNEASEAKQGTNGEQNGEVIKTTSDDLKV